MAKTSPTQRSKKFLEAAGYKVAITEKWNAFARVRQDAFGFIDMLAIGHGHIVGVQTTSRSNMLARQKKIVGLPEAWVWLSSGGKIEVHGWAKLKKSRKYEIKVVQITRQSFYEPEHASRDQEPQTEHRGPGKGARASGKDAGKVPRSKRPELQTGVSPVLAVG